LPVDAGGDGDKEVMPIHDGDHRAAGNTSSMIAAMPCHSLLNLQALRNGIDDAGELG
jgi:hypothetical protein